MNNLKICNYRYCRNQIDQNANKNRSYCINENGDSKCYRNEKLCRMKDQKKEKEILSKRKSELEITLKNLMLGKNQNCKITEDRFNKMLYEYMDLFELKKINDSTVYYFTEYHLYKVLHDEIYYIEIFKLRKYEN